MVDRSVVKAVQSYLHALQAHGFPVKFGVVFGSQATGKADHWSDIDLLVVSPRFDGDVAWSDMDALMRLAARVDSRIEPIPCGESQWREDNRSAIVEIARREGERILLPEVA